MPNFMKGSWAVKGGGIIVLAVVGWLVEKILDRLSDTVAKMADIEKLSWGIPIFLLFVGVFLLFSPAIEKCINRLGEKKKQPEPLIKDISTYSDEEFEATIHQWITHSSLKHWPNIKTDGVLFSYNVEKTPSALPLGVTITRLKSAQEMLQISVEMIFPNEITTFILSLPMPVVQEASENLALELTRFEAKFEISDRPFERILIFDLISIDNNLTEFRLLERISFVMRAYAMVKVHFDRLLRDPGYKGEANNPKTENNQE